MNMLSSTALSGLNAAQTRLGAAANNIANMNTPGFRRDEVNAVPQAGGGVSVSVGKAANEGPDLVRDVVEELHPDPTRMDDAVAHADARERAA